MYGAWVDGVSVLVLGLLLVAFVASLYAVLHWISRRPAPAAAAAEYNRL
jgi:hypothetical protein